MAGKDKNTEQRQENRDAGAKVQGTGPVSGGTRKGDAAKEHEEVQRAFDQQGPKGGRPLA